MPLRVTLPLFKVKLLPARLPSILIFPVPLTLLPFRLRVPPSCGDVSSTKSTFASFVLAIAALAFISALTIAPSAILADVMTPLSIVKVSPLLLTVISPLSPSSIPPPPPDISATVPLSFFVNNLPLSVLIATSPTSNSLALGLLPLAFYNFIVTDICSHHYKLILVSSSINIKNRS